MTNLPLGPGQPLERVANPGYNLNRAFCWDERGLNFDYVEVLPPKERVASYQVVGEVKAHQAYDG